jgi:hypothetical protein
LSFSAKTSVRLGPGNLLPLVGGLALVLFCTSAWTVRAGDAVAIGYNSEGVWTAVIYYCSSTPKGGKDYKDSAQAREAALRDLRKRAGDNLAKADVLADSDLTGFFAVARGKTESGKDVTVVSYGKAQAEADKKALADLERAGATAKQKIFYRYFSYGADSAAKP